MREALEALIGAMAVPRQAAPALMLGLVVLAAMPVLVVAGAIWRAFRRHARKSAAGNVTRIGAAWPREAWLEIERQGEPARFAIKDGLVRIGRERDNEICLRDDSVHRYHAAVHCTGDAEVRVTDLSSAAGNGVLVNGRRIGSARLKDGDRIALGSAYVVFHSVPLAAREIAIAAER